MKISGLICLSLLLLLMPCRNTYAQDFKLSGAIFERGTKIRIALAEISNKNNRYSTGSNDMGLFTINASVGDTLLITKRGYNDVEIAVESSRSLIIYLNQSITLNEVVVEGQNKKQALDDIKQDFKDKGSFYAGKPPLGLLSPFGGSPLTFLYELFGRTPRNARRFNNYYNTEVEQLHIDGFYNKALINKYTGLAGKELEDFMINYRPSYEQAKNWTTYDGIKWITDSYKKYQESLENKN